MRVTHTLPPGSPTKRQAIRWGRWREGKVRPKPGNSPHDRPVSRGTLSSLEENLRRFLPRHLAAKLRSIILRSQYAFLKAWRNLSGPMWSENQTPGRDRTASRWSAPSPGRRTRREDHAADEFRPAIPRSGWSPPEPVSASPARPDYHAPPAGPFKTGTFYFAGKRKFLLCLDRRVVHTRWTVLCSATIG